MTRHENRQGADWLGEGGQCEQGRADEADAGQVWREKGLEENNTIKRGMKGQ